MYHSIVGGTSKTLASNINTEASKLMKSRGVKTKTQSDGRDFDRYIEVFGGGGSVLFYKDKHAPLEIYNDANGQPVNLFNHIKVYDRPKALFYCDPPYYKTENYYDAEFKSEDHERLKHCLKAIKGRFILSYNDDDYIRELYKEFNITAVERQNNLSKGTYKELIIANY